MANFNSLELPSIVPAGSYSMAIANIGEQWLPDVQALLRTASSPRCTAVADFVLLSERTYTIISGMETKQFDSQVGLWSQDWKALENYNWLFTDQNTIVASSWTIEAKVWHPTYAEELVYWLCIGGLAIRTAIKEKQSLQLRAEAFNVANHANYCAPPFQGIVPAITCPDNSFNSPTFGKILGASDGRIMQMALKYVF